MVNYSYTIFHPASGPMIRTGTSLPYLYIVFIDVGTPFVPSKHTHTHTHTHRFEFQFWRGPGGRRDAKGSKGLHRGKDRRNIGNIVRHSRPNRALIEFVAVCYCFYPALLTRIRERWGEGGGGHTRATYLSNRGCSNQVCAKVSGCLFQKTVQGPSFCSPTPPPSPNTWKIMAADFYPPPLMII
jgi:hypothetical protein